MGELKTKPTQKNPKDFLATVNPEQRKKDGLALLKMFEQITGEKPVMWGAGIVGFGQYHYKSARSAQEGDWFLTGFSPRKQNLSLYILNGIDSNLDLLKKLGKHKASKGCLYINKLADVDQHVLEQLITRSFYYAKKTLIA